MAASRLCSIPNCGKRIHGRGWCIAHYKRWKRHGDPLGGGTGMGERARYLNEVVLPYDGNECLLWPYGNIKGYGVVTIDGKQQLVPRVVCISFRGPPPSPKHEAAHSCGHGDQGCCTKRHLDWKTPAANAADKIGHGTHVRGEKQNGAKLAEADVRRIRALRGTLSQSKIAAMFDIDQSTVCDIQLRNRWAYLD